MDSIKIPKADSSKNDSNLDEQLDKELSQLEDKKIEVVEASNSGKRKMEDNFINENKSFLNKQNQAKEIKDKQKKGDSISNKEASFLREIELDRKKSSSSKDKTKDEPKDEPKEKKDIPENDPAEKIDESEKTADNEDNKEEGVDNQEDGWNTWTKNWKGENKSEEKEPNQEQTAENLKEEADQAFQELLKGDSNLQEIKKKRGLFKKNLAILGIGKEKDTSLKKELEEQEKTIEVLKQKYESKFNEFSQKLVKEREQELRNEGKSEASINDLIGSFAFDGKAISVDKKLENGKTETEKISTIEYFNRNQKKLAENREGFLSEKQKEVLKKISGKYNSLSKTQKIIGGVGLSATAGATVMLAGGAAVSVALGYGAWRGGKTLLRRATVGAVSGVAIKGMNTGLARRAEKKNIADLEKAKGEFVSGFKDGQFNLYNILSEQNQRERKRDRNRRIAVGVTTGALFGTAIGVEAMMSGDVLDKIPGDKESSNFIKADSDKIPADVEGKKFFDKDRMIADKINEDKTGADIKQEEGLAGDKNLKEEFSAKAFEEGLKLNSSFELAEDGNVWNSLSEHFDGNKQEVGKVLAGFRAETMKDLMENHGMSEVQADQFIEWRYRHMDIGTEFGLKDGKLEIPGFDDERKIARFEEQNLSKGRGVGESAFDDRESIPPTSQEAVDIPESVKTVEILDPKISAQVDQNINSLIRDVYGGQAYEWDVMKNKNALDVINGEFGNPIKEGVDGRGMEINEFIESERGALSDNGLDQAEINNRKQLNQILLALVEQSGEQPLPEETVEQFIRRIEVAHYTQSVAENVPGDASVEIPEPTGTVEIMDPDTSEQIEKIYGQQNSEWEAVKNRSADHFIDNKYDDSKLSQAEVKRNEELKELLLNRIKETREFPESGGNFGKPESIEEYLIRTSKS